MLTLTVSSYGEQVFDRTFTRFANNLETPRGAIEEVAALLRAIVEIQFETEGRHASGGWKPLTEARRIFKAEHGLDPRILRATDHLRQSLTRKFDSDHIERLSADELVFGSSVAYGVYHQSSQPRTIMPYRPPIALTQADKRDIVKTVQRSLVAAERVAHPPLWGAR